MKAILHRLFEMFSAACFLLSFSIPSRYHPLVPELVVKDSSCCSLFSASHFTLHRCPHGCCLADYTHTQTVVHLLTGGRLSEIEVVAGYLKEVVDTSLPPSDLLLCGCGFSIQMGWCIKIRALLQLLLGSTCLRRSLKRPLYICGLFLRN